METKIANRVNLEFNGLSYLSIIENCLFWQSEGRWVDVVQLVSTGERKVHYSSEKGSLKLGFVQSHIKIFDSKTNYFSISLYFIGNSICFKTKKPQEADNLFEKIQECIYGFSLDNQEGLGS